MLSVGDFTVPPDGNFHRYKEQACRGCVATGHVGCRAGVCTRGEREDGGYCWCSEELNEAACVSTGYAPCTEEDGGGGEEHPTAEQRQQQTHSAKQERSLAPQHRRQQSQEDGPGDWNGGDPK